jgi:hypothetical protein
MASTHNSPATPDNSSPSPRAAWRFAMAIVRPAAAGTAAWSLYTVARHYGVPWQLALVASLVYDGIAIGCLYQATEAVRAGRSAAAPIAATLGMASASVYLNLVHARLIHGGRPAEVLFASPILGLLALSALSWSADRATARAARGETPMRLPAYGVLGWAFARASAWESLKERAEVHVTSGASPTHQPAAPAVRSRAARDVLAERFAAMDPVEAIQIAADSHPHLDPAGIASLLGAYHVRVDALQVALVLGRAATPSVTLDRVQPDPAPARAEQPALGATMHGDTTSDMPLVKGMTTSQAITTIAEHLGGLNADPKAIVQHLALQGRATDTGYVRTALWRARKAEKAAAEEAEQQRADDERRYGSGGYA